MNSYALSQSKVLVERLIVLFAVPWCAVPCRGEVWASGGETTHRATPLFRSSLFLYPWRAQTLLKQQLFTSLILCRWPKQGPCRAFQAESGPWGGNGQHRNAPLRPQTPTSPNLTPSELAKDTILSVYSGLTHKQKDSSIWNRFSFVNHITWTSLINSFLSVLLVPNDWRKTSVRNC